MGPEWRDSAAQVFVGSLEAPEPEPDDAHHLRRVLRLRPGERVCAADGRGGWRMCVMTGAGELEPVGEIRREPAPVPLAVGFTPVKAEKPEWVVQKLTEVGIDTVWVLQTQRSVVRWDDERAARNLDRLRSVAREAAAQCRRLWLPAVQRGEGLPVGAVLADAGGRALTPGDDLVLVGPEGGWSDDERRGAEVVGLGENVLRAGTAAVVAGAAMASLRLGLSRRGLP